MSYAAIVGDDEEALRIEWEEKMKDVAKKMSEVLNSYEWFYLMWPIPQLLFYLSFYALYLFYRPLP